MQYMDKSFTVSELNAYVRDLLRADPVLRQIVVRGEIGNLRNYQGHLYFTLKDEKSSIRAVMWRSDSARLTFVPEEGTQVVAAGGVSVFERDGIYQLYVNYMEPGGLGAQYAALERLKAKLEKEGLFRQERKRPLPFFPRRIGVVTSLRGAAINDIVTVGRRRFRGVSFLVADSKVQGEGAAPEIVQGIMRLGLVPDVDVIIVGRGGGSQEDLFVWNDESVARAIYGSRVPVVSAVGHERDISVSDLVADARAATPSQAAEMVVPRASELRAAVASFREGMAGQVYKLLGAHRQTLASLQSRPALGRPDWFLVSSRESMVRLRGDLEGRMAVILERGARRFQNAAGRLDALSPLQVLGRGYSIARREEDMGIVREYTQAPPGTKILLTLGKGQLSCEVLGAQPEHSLLGKEVD